MLSNLGQLLIHFVGAALACAQLAYWAIRLLTPPPAPAPAPVQALAVHEPDPVLVARAFGQVELGAPAAIANIQLAGVYAAGRDSAAVFIVGDRPARAVRIGEEVAPGSKLVEVDSESATLEAGGVRHQLRVPNPPAVASNGPAGSHAAGFEQHGNVLTAPMVETAPTTRPVNGRSPGFMPAPPRLETRAEPGPGMPGHHDMVGMPTVQ
ncbi:MAG TPA: type II secretion system protein N [Burkholderiaceae bacterium]|nr:type II secretion system protein N [Burkholderiaceae bacterium]